jgi:hypothetical protein
VGMFIRSAPIDGGFGLKRFPVGARARVFSFPPPPSPRFSVFGLVFWFGAVF